MLLLPPSSAAPDPPLVPVPIYLVHVSAGFPSPAEDYLEGQLDLNRLVVKTQAATFFVRATGDSMIGVGIRPGDLLVVDRSLDPRHGSVVVAVLDGCLTVKVLDRRAGGVTLRPANAAHRPIAVGEDADLKVWGVVTYVVHKV
jgi:DNA polymerase V